MSPENEDRLCQQKPIIGVSRCLMGEAVRYDGGSKPVPWIRDILSEHCDLLALCPEVEAGLGVPRPPVRLVGSMDSPRALGVEDPALDVTELLLKIGADKREAIAAMDGLILKAGSPSCGIFDTPVFDDKGMETGQGGGLFSRTCRENFPGLPLIDESFLENEAGRVGFLIQVFRYRCQRLRGQGFLFDDRTG